MAYVLTGTGLPPWAEVGALQVGLQSSALLAVNNTRDVEGDVVAGKRTLAVAVHNHYKRISQEPPPPQPEGEEAPAAPASEVSADAA